MNYIDEPRINAVQLAGALPRDPEFREWVSEQDQGYHAPDMDTAAEYIRERCGITSRRELATDTEAQARFHDFIRRPYVAWREQQHQPA